MEGEVTNNIMDIIKDNLEKNKAILSEIMRDYDNKAQLTSREQKTRYSRKSLTKFIEIRRNPGRKARSSGSSFTERTPLQMKVLTSEKSITPDRVFEENSSDIEWKSPPSKKIRLSAPLSDIRRSEDITEEELSRVIIDPRIKKIYRGNQLSTCHQCRQKTQDMKTICRSGFCRGVQGQFCGICLYNRYGENAKEALLDDNWSCPVCRNICNCSFCLPKKGKPCTGILVPEARKHGFTNVHSFLDSLSRD